MPRLLTVMGWNIENFGNSKYNRANGGAELIAVLAAVITANDVDVAAFCEIRSNLGDDIGKELTTKLNGNKTGKPWKYEESSQYGKQRWEQYLFIWNTTKVTSYSGFQDTFKDPANTKNNLGFPGQKIADRPPFLGYFQTVGKKKKKVLVSMMHAPAPSKLAAVNKAANNMAKVAEFQSQGDTCIIMGDFNVKAPVDATKAGPGKNAFGPFLKVKPKPFDQLLPNDWASSLIPRKNAWVGMKTDDCYSSPYDQLFFRQNNSALTAAKEGVDELIQESMKKKYLEKYLVALWGKIVTGTAPTGFKTVEDAFEAFRYCVSDHMPVIVDVNG